MPFRTAVARLLPRARRRPTPAPEPVEQRLRDGETLIVRLTDQILISADLENGLATEFTQIEPMEDEHGRQLLYMTRYASTCPPGHRPPLHFAPPAGEAATIPITLTGRQHRFLGDVLAAYFRITNEE